jgi:hypothetical protein
VNPCNASISAAHLRSNVIKPLPRKNCASTRQVSFIYLQLIAYALQFHSSAALYRAWSVWRSTKQLMNCSAWMQTPTNLPRIPMQRFVPSTRQTTSTQHDICTKTFVESADCTSRYVPHSFWVTRWTVARISSSLPLHQLQMMLHCYNYNCRETGIEVILVQSKSARGRVQGG